MLKEIFAGLALAAAATGAAAQSYTVEPRHTHITWATSHFGTSTFRGKLNKTSGKVVLDAAAKTGSVEISVDTSGQLSGDDRLDKHLAGEDFFNIGKFATATFKSTKVEFNGAAPSRIEGELTMLGITRPLTLTVTAFHCRMHPGFKKDFCGADATATIKRTDWGMKYGVPNVGDEVKLDIAIEALKD
jgi:polyisoprenoid-binding protein YceI